MKKIGVDNIAKKSKYKDKIIITLEKKSLNLNNLYHEVKGVNKFSKSDNPFYEALMGLLKENKIRLSGYDFSNNRNDRIQSLKKEGLVFELVKNGQHDILCYLELLENDDPNTVKESKNKLQTFFKDKLEKYEEQESDLWKNTYAKVSSMPIIDGINILREEEFFDDPEEMGHLGYLMQLVNDHQNAKMWYFADLSKEEAHKLLNLDLDSPSKPDPYRSIAQNHKSVVMGKTLQGCTPREVADFFKLNDFLIDEHGSWTSETFLEKKGITKPKERSEEDIRIIFNKILFFINSHNSKFMRQSFSWSLSDEEDSMEWFRILLEGIIFSDQYISLKNKLKNELLGYNPLESLTKAIEYLNERENRNANDEKMDKLWGDYGIR